MPFFQTAGDMSAYGGIYGENGRYALKVFFQDVADRIDISGAFSYGTHVSDTLTPGTTYELKTVPGGPLKFKVTPGDPGCAEWAGAIPCTWAAAPAAPPPITGMPRSSATRMKRARNCPIRT